MKTSRNLVVAAGLLLLSVFVEGGVPQFRSTWAPAPAKVDGTADAWSALLRPLGNMSMVIGVQNDADFLYLCFKTSNPALKRQLLSTGLTVWANGTGKNSVAWGFGVRYPLKEVGDGNRHEGRKPAPPQEKEGTVPAFVPPPAEFELIGPTVYDRRRLELGGDEPVEAALGDDSGVMVLELKLPLKTSGAYALAGKDASGAILGIWLGAMAPVEKPRKVWADDVNGHGGQQQPPEDAPEMPAPFALWVQVTLAPPPPAAK